MKLVNKFLAGISMVAMALLAFAPAAHASLGFDTYKMTRTYVVAPPQNIIWVTGAGGILTNPAVDLVYCVGTVKMDIVAETNTGTTGGALQAILQGSQDTTNWSTLTNFALISTPTSVTITNASYGTTNLIATNSLMLQGTPTTPTAASAGFATPYLSYFPYTNSSPVTLNPGVTQIGFNSDDQPRYMRVIFAPSGTVTNWTAGAILTGAQFQQ